MNRSDKVMSALVRAVGATVLIYCGLWLVARLWGPALGFVGPTTGGWIMPAILFPVVVLVIMALLLKGEA